MSLKKLLLVGDHFIRPELMRDKLGSIAFRFEVIETSTSFPLEPFHPIAEVSEASGSEEQMIDALQGVSICIAHHAPLTERILRHSPDLRLFVVCRGGPVNVNVKAATQHGVRIAYTPGRNAVATAEHTIAMMLCAIRGIPQADTALRQGNWKGDYTWQTAGFELETATVGLVGYGAIGRKVAHILRGFGATVLACDPCVKIDQSDGVEQTSLDDLLARSNILSLHLRDTPETRGIIGKEQISQLSRGSVIVNCARGVLLDYVALEEALCTGQLFAAAADVFACEPLPPNSPLLSLNNFIMTPHIAGGTRQAAEKAAAIAAAEVQRFIHGRPIRFCVNPEVNVPINSNGPALAPDAKK